ncbi:MAG TPA: hypothetical protein VIM73_14015, partial [Polyangiaceae bacterium]
QLHVTLFEMLQPTFADLVSHGSLRGKSERSEREGRHRGEGSWMARTESIAMAGVLDPQVSRPWGPSPS